MTPASLHDAYAAVATRKQKRHDREMAVLQMARDACKKIGLTWEQFAGPGRHRALAGPRHAVWRALKMQGCTYPEIARVCGNRDHSTVISGVRKVESAMASRTFVLLPGAHTSEEDALDWCEANGVEQPRLWRGVDGLIRGRGEWKK
ncbi:MAG: helix-turn-helix domain-containing protein [Nitrospira sp.]|nr:helix-turn-helix domain-containing protein [Nitrospira sp.]